MFSRCVPRCVLTHRQYGGACRRQEPNQSHGDATDIRLRPLSVRQARDYRRQSLRRHCGRQLPEPRRFLPGIDAESRKRREHGDDEPILLFADRRKQKIIELGFQQRERRRQCRFKSTHASRIGAVKRVSGNQHDEKDGKNNGRDQPSGHDAHLRCSGGSARPSRPQVPENRFAPRFTLDGEDRPSFQGNGSESPRGFVAYAQRTHLLRGRDNGTTQSLIEHAHHRGRATRGL